MPQFQWLDDEQLIHDQMFEELPRQVRNLVDEVNACEGGLTLLRLLDLNSKTLKTLDDIAKDLGQPQPTVEKSLYALLDAGLVRWVNLAGLVFFGITDDPERRELVRVLWDWQDRWHARLARIERVIDGKRRSRISLEGLRPDRSEFNETSD